MIDIEELKKLALAATPGPWEWWTSNSVLRLSGADGKDGGVISATMHAHWPDIMVNWENREYLAAANPQTVLALLSELAAVRQELEEARKDAERYRWLRAVGADSWHCEDQRVKVFPAHAKAYFRIAGRGESLDTAIDAARQQPSKETIVFDNPSYPAWLAENGKQSS